MEGKLKVWINGAFDVLHVGHMRLLQLGASLGSVRVGLDSDKRIRELKGRERPYNTLKDRVEFISSVKYVDDVVTFNTREELIERIKEYQPDLMVIGDDYRGKEIVGIEYIPKVVYYNKVKGKSTSSILSYEKSDSNRGPMY